MTNSNQAVADRPPQPPASNQSGEASPIHVILIVQAVMVASAVAAALFCLF